MSKTLYIRMGERDIYVLEWDAVMEQIEIQADEEIAATPDDAADVIFSIGFAKRLFESLTLLDLIPMPVIEDEKE